MKKTAKFRELLFSQQLTFICEAHNGLSAKIVEKAGFSGIWASQALVGDEREGEANHDRRKRCQPRSLCRLSDDRGRHPKANVRGGFAVDRGTKPKNVNIHVRLAVIRGLRLLRAGVVYAAGSGSGLSVDATNVRLIIYAENRFRFSVIMRKASAGMRT